MARHTTTLLCLPVAFWVASVGKFIIDAATGLVVVLILAAVALG